MFYFIAGHSFRATVATQMVNAGATKNQLMEKFNWHSKKMPTEYTRNSKLAQKQVAEMLVNGGNEDMENFDPNLEFSNGIKTDENTSGIKTGEDTDAIERAILKSKNSSRGIKLFDLIFQKIK